jgi:hypothetical protein
MNLFLSYNPEIDLERIIVLRIQTLASVYGTSILLPDRYHTNTLKHETKVRIRQSHVFVVFITNSISDIVKEEIEYALKLKRKVVIVFDPKLIIEPIQNSILIPFDFQNGSLPNLFNEISKHKNSFTESKNDKTLVTVLGVAVGLFLFYTLLGDERETVNI